MTDREKAIVMAHTGVCMLTGNKFQIFHEYVEEIMGRPVLTHELAWLGETIKEKSKKDFYEICETEEKDYAEAKIDRFIQSELASAKESILNGRLMDDVVRETKQKGVTEMTYDELLDKFETAFPFAKVQDYRPVCHELFENDKVGITLWLDNGDMVVYYPKQGE